MTKRDSGGTQWPEPFPSYDRLEVRDRLLNLQEHRAMSRVRIGDGFRAAWVLERDVAHISGTQIETDADGQVGCRVVMRDGMTIELGIGPDRVAH